MDEQAELNDLRSFARWALTDKINVPAAACVAGKMLGVTAPHAYPVFPESVREVELLLDAVPSWRPRLGEMAEVSPKWAALVEAWPRIVAMMDRECPHWRQPNPRAAWPKAYGIMTSALRKAEGAS